MENTYKYKINKSFDGYTLYSFLESFNLGKAKIKSFFLQKIYINSVLSGRKDILHENDILEIEVERFDKEPSYKKDLKVVYEDNNILIIDKPLNIIIHSDGVNNDKTLVNIVRYYYDIKGYNIPVRYIHRLDMQTSGLMVFVKDPLTNAYYSSLLKTHQIDRRYLALVSGRLDSKDFDIDKKIGKDRHHNSRRRVSETGVDAKTHVHVVEEYKHFSLVELKLFTGRTHQIRVHMKYTGHPLLGDTLYGGGEKYIKRVALHSYYIYLQNPVTKKDIELKLDLPSDMKRVIDNAKPI